MEAVVLAGGFGTRLREVVPDVPKPMAPVAGRPFLEIILSTLADKNFRRVILSVGYKAKKISSYFGNTFAGMDLVYSTESRPLGTGGAAQLASEKCCEDHVYVFNGDTYLDVEIELIEEQWLKNKAPVLVARYMEDAVRYGVIEESKGRVLNFSEKTKSGPGLVNTGCYLFPKNMLLGFNGGDSFSLEKDLITPLVKSVNFGLFVTKGKFIDIGIPSEYERAQVFFK